ncbi:serine/threonine-protein kinase [Polyangium jinanense]|uniref:Serine/threonine protein kinase n=1 Tax=Polyangium jinanense TaxID=2829994 RepID=A0A9X4AXN4_9BACT|nr:serine/threonine-protein kinase [Polyangium jinanense]MDC3958213.1 serine/threonine protein kinase [Polyangium jinanense]MDC3988101.1 serine/threonine protein kinase [Polyangium jinanense]
MDSAPPSLATQIARQRVGRVLRDKWRLEGVLGTGGFGAVYAATHRTGKRVAIKIIHPELNAIADARDRFLREAYAVNAVSHPGMVSILDDDVDEDGCVFLVMELLDGETLEARRLRSGGSLDFDDVLSMADPILDVLAAAHEKGVVHRDLKPENVFLLRTGQIKLLDFGVAKLREAPRGKALTVNGIVIGTPAFMPPEQARGQWQNVDERSDLYSVGATLFTLLTGQFVHGNLTPQESLVAAVTTPAPSLATISPGAPRALVELLARALAFERKDRFQTAREMQAAVREVYHELSGGLATTAPREAARVPSHEDEETTQTGSDDEPTAVLSRMPHLALARRLPSTTALSPKLVSPDGEPTIVEASPSVTLKRSVSGLVGPESRGQRLASIFDSADFGDQSELAADIAKATAELNTSAEAAAAQKAVAGPDPEEATIPNLKEEPGKPAARKKTPEKALARGPSRTWIYVVLVVLVVGAIVAFALLRAKPRRATAPPGPGAATRIEACYAAAWVGSSPSGSSRSSWS